MATFPGDVKLIHAVILNYVRVELNISMYLFHL